MIKRLSLAALLLVCTVGTAHASTSTVSFADIGNASVNTGDINTATVFTIGDLLSTSTSGFFAGMPDQNFGPVTYNITVPGSLSFSSPDFGTFTSTSITPFDNSVLGSTAAYILGNYTAGSYGSETSGTASFTISWTQTPPGTGGISDSATLSIPPSAPPGAPEPSSLLMGLIGAGIAGACYLARRKTTVPLA